MMLCIADGYCTDDSAILSRIAHNFKTWSCGNPKGIGEHTYKVLLIGDYEKEPIEVSKLIWEISGRKTAGNGGVMRTSIVGLFPKDVEEWAANICRLTHYDPRCVGSCVIVSNMIHSLVYDDTAPSFQQILDWGKKYDDRIKDYIELARQDNLNVLELQDSNSMGYTLKTLAVGLWAYWHASSFEEGLLSVVNAGGDADTNAAVACAILGAKFGFQEIPKEYVRDLAHKNRLEDVIESLLSLQGVPYLKKMGIIDKLFYWLDWKR